MVALETGNMVANTNVTGDCQCVQLSVSGDWYPNALFRLSHCNGPANTPGLKPYTRKAGEFGSRPWWIGLAQTYHQVLHYTCISTHLHATFTHLYSCTHMCTFLCMHIRKVTTVTPSRELQPLLAWGRIKWNQLWTSWIWVIHVHVCYGCGQQLPNHASICTDFVLWKRKGSLKGVAFLQGQSVCVYLYRTHTHHKQSYCVILHDCTD